MAKRWVVDKDKSSAYETVLVNSKSGEVRTLETESGRMKRYANELKAGEGLTKGGKKVKLTKEARAYRSGALDANKRRAKIFKKKNPDYVRKTK